MGKYRSSQRIYRLNSYYFYSKLKGEIRAT